MHVNVITRLQAQGTPGHPHHYSSAWDATKKTFHADGIRGFYKGLGPTLFKVGTDTCVVDPLLFNQMIGCTECQHQLRSL